jgi:hypothetical protein
VETNQTWVLVHKPVDRSNVSCRWLFKRKYDSSSLISNFKACLVARGFSQVPDIDYHETFSPVIRLTSLRVLFAIVVHHNLEIHQLDVKTAFQNGF